MTCSVIIDDICSNYEMYNSNLNKKDKKVE